MTRITNPSSIDPTAEGQSASSHHPRHPLHNVCHLSQNFYPLILLMLSNSEKGKQLQSIRAILAQEKRHIWSVMPFADIATGLVLQQLDRYTPESGAPVSSKASSGRGGRIGTFRGYMISSTVRPSVPRATDVVSLRIPRATSTGSYGALQAMNV